jgi:hypothetical protein
MTAMVFAGIDHYLLTFGSDGDSTVLYREEKVLLTEKNKNWFYKDITIKLLFFRTGPFFAPSGH